MGATTRPEVTVMLLPTLISVLLLEAPAINVEVAEDEKGRFATATATVTTEVPLSQVWAALLKMDQFKTFMPKVLVSEVKPAKDAKEPGWDTRLVLDVPGPDTDYTAHFTPDEATHTLTGRQVKGDLKGSVWVWRLAEQGGKTVIRHTVAVKNFSGLAQSLEDDGQTVTLGVNVGAALAAVKALKRKVEADAAAVPAAAAGSK